MRQIESHFLFLAGEGRQLGLEGLLKVGRCLRELDLREPLLLHGVVHLEPPLHEVVIQEPPFLELLLLLPLLALVLLATIPVTHQGSHLFGVLILLATFQEEFLFPNLFR